MAVSLKEPLRRRVADESGDRLAVTRHRVPNFFRYCRFPVARRSPLIVSAISMASRLGGAFRGDNRIGLKRAEFDVSDMFLLCSSLGQKG